MSETVSADARQPYEAPTIEDVPLRPEEQILAGCKTSTAGGPNFGGGPGTCGGSIQQCMSFGTS